MKKIDAHLHYYGDRADNIAFLEGLELKLLNICVSQDTAGAWRQRAEIYHKLQNQFPERYAWVTSFDLPDFTADYADRVIEGVQKDFDTGAIACKVWKNVGMEVKNPSGEFVMVDDPLFDPIWEFLTREDRTLLMHIGGPLACWRPLVDDNPHFGYYSRNPRWHMYNRPEYPSHEEIMAARDRMVEKHPKLRIVGAHLASLEFDVAEIARRLDRFPNFAVDSSARVADLAYQDTDTVRQFFTTYSDRLLFGTDVVRMDCASELSPEERKSQIDRFTEHYEMEFAYYESGEVVNVRGKENRGLNLPVDILEKFYLTNAQTWYPGL
jgi:predicted TIM-barrel fold metal-dependent hydrolase